MRMGKLGLIHYFLLYLLLINLVSLVLFAADKKRAKANGPGRGRTRKGKTPQRARGNVQKPRIPEKTLFVVAAVGGSIGAILGMWIFHHKTRHWYFVYGMPAILVGQLLIAWVAMKGI